MFDFMLQGYASFEYESLRLQIASLEALLLDLAGDKARPREIDPKRPYAIKDAAAFLGVSVRTLQRRRSMGRLRFVGDGKKSFIMGAELLRYARESYK